MICSANNKLNKFNLISKGDDYQILFTASPEKAKIIHNTSKNLGIKITRIGKISSRSKKSIITLQKIKSSHRLGSFVLGHSRAMVRCRSDEEKSSQKVDCDYQ